MVVESLLEATDHDHLGKLITYAAALQAPWAVLVAREFRREHRSALIWLNSITGEGSGFFGREVQAVRIADSHTAVPLDVVVSPDDSSRRARAGTQAMSETKKRYTEWWSTAQMPSYSNWMNFPSGRGGVYYTLNFAYPTGATNYSLSARVYMDDGESTYPALEAQRPAIEADYGGPLQWEPSPNTRHSRVGDRLQPADPTERDRWPEYRQWAIKTLGELRRAFSEPIRTIP